LAVVFACFPGHFDLLHNSPVQFELIAAGVAEWLFAGGSICNISLETGGKRSQGY
jgi:hypothetical protein